MACCTEIIWELQSSIHDDFYQASCAREQRAQWARSMSVATMANKKALFTMPNDSKHVFFHSFWLIHYAYELLRYLDVEMWQFWWSQQTTDRQTDCFIPYACSRGNQCWKIICIFYYYLPERRWLECGVRERLNGKEKNKLEKDSWLRWDEDTTSSVIQYYVSPFILQVMAERQQQIDRKLDILKAQQVVNYSQ